MIPLFSAIRIQSADARVDAFFENPVGTLVGGVLAIGARLLFALLILLVALLVAPFALVATLLDKIINRVSRDMPGLVERGTPNHAPPWAGE